MSVEIQRQFVLARLDVKALEPTIEVVNLACEITIDEDLGLARGYLQTIAKTLRPQRAP